MAMIFVDAAADGPSRFWQSYGTVFDTIVADGVDVRAAVVTSVFPKIFTAGLDCEWCWKLDKICYVYPNDSG